DPQRGLITFLGARDLDDWKVTRETVTEAAEQNLSRTLREAEPHIKMVEGSPVLSLVTQFVMKASLLFAPDLCAVLNPLVGWPALAVAPCRDFILLFPDAARKLLIPRLGSIVLREFSTSGYPLTKEVLRISDDGIKAIGRF